MGIFLISVFWQNKKSVLIGFCVLMFALAFWRQDFLSKPENLSSGIPVSVYNDLTEAVKVSGVISDEPKIGLGDVKYEVDTSEIEINGRNEKIGGKILLSASKYPVYQYGDEIEIIGKLKTPPAFDDFNYRAYLAKENVFSIVNYSKKISLISSGNGKIYYSYIFALKNKIEKIIADILPEPQASFLSALLIGSRGALPDDLLESFSRTGTTHIIAISGYNIAIIASVFAATLGFFRFSRPFIFWLTVFMIILFTILTGAQASVVRAAIMGFLVLLASKEGRIYQITNAIIFSAAAMLWFNPKLLRWDAGFQLSFLATLGLIYIHPVLSSFLNKKDKNVKSDKILSRIAGSGKEIFLASLSAQIAVLPVLIYNFDQFSLISPLANVLILPVIPLTMFFGFAAAGIGFIFLPVAKIIGYIAWLFLSYEIFIAEKFAGLPYAFLNVAKFSFGFVILYYIILVWLIWKIKKPVFLPAVS